ncbi:hypothetical protein C8R41DRAFT_865339 [Lentinula lateritia]|uniref:Uncharacterized protein n=1 Tax=Lentinula lateritia TaxID=40482 RepID=A0ABQ8VMD7_9AGAR|nr:hypothetical protein C8R41DRAFT_865339 [Lentinula lateritia]
MLEYNSGLDTTLRPPTPHVKLWTHLNNYHHDHVMFEYNSGLDTTLRPPTPHVKLWTHLNNYQHDHVMFDNSSLIVWLRDILKIAHIDKGVLFDQISNFLCNKNMTFSLQNDLKNEINLNVEVGTFASEKAGASEFNYVATTANHSYLLSIQA